LGCNVRVITAVDVIICLILLGSMAAGFRNGFLVELIDLAAFYVGLAVAAQYTGLAAPVVYPMVPGLPTYAIDSLLFLMILGVISGLLATVARLLLTARRNDQSPSQVSQVLGFALGLIVGIASVAVLLPAVRHASAASWGASDGARASLVAAVSHSPLVPLFDSATLLVHASIRPLLPAGIPPTLTGRLG
jgi:uncharacterized membrane protein required for colicin V production